ncbi:hypothetical protein VFPPC_16218 [Pochonia chlamydosporia 170]|uniref:Uncharacterized protein n=1 Tax=Pochonia chlamydosporia 170 TaxID=1380566 RepID=A0A179FFU0_METCM|nr:hypothetical protein VFPPC_16218 [Pochonia chlamydosporia 170]OAQ64475.1 hypothetical protein VFPPC_16218 [Pochonia chlamydosporia 170]
MVSHLPCRDVICLRVIREIAKSWKEVWTLSSSLTDSITPFYRSSTYKKRNLQSAMYSFLVER